MDRDSPCVIEVTCREIRQARNIGHRQDTQIVRDGAVNMAETSNSGLTRRALLGAFAATAVTAAPTFSNAAGFLRGGGDIRRIRMYSGRTGERLDMVYWIEGKYIKDAVREINHFMRDWRRNEVKPIDPQLVLGLLELQQKARRNGFSGEVRFLSGYRSRATNEMLRRKTNGVAKHSMHIQARAIDFSLPHVPIRETIRLAKELSLGGVGGYASFVHIDSGSRRAWGLS
mgnify:CR=1 FL=1